MQTCRVQQLEHGFFSLNLKECHRDLGGPRHSLVTGTEATTQHPSRRALNGAESEVAKEFPLGQCPEKAGVGLPFRPQHSRATPEPVVAAAWTNPRKVLSPKPWALEKARDAENAVKNTSFGFRI